jgi:uncharacterized membrane protein YfcA
MEAVMHSSIEALTLLLVALLAGAVNAIAGGGTLLSFPVLVWFGVPVIMSNATSTLAMFLGTAGSIYGFRRQLPLIGRRLKWLLPVSVLGGWLGGVLLTRSSERLFAALVPPLILFATLMFLLQRWLRSAPEAHAAPWMVVLLQFCIAIYGGYFGAGIGILMLAALGLLGMRDLHEANALKNVLAAAINCVASVWFIAAGLIDWPRAAIMTAGTVVGYFLGAHYSQRVPQQYVRTGIVIAGFAAALILAWRQYRP